MRKAVPLILISFLLNTFYISEGYAFVDSSSYKICQCNHNSEKEIHEDEKMISNSHSDCHSSKKNEPHRCVCKTSKSKKNSNVKVSIPMIFLEENPIDPILTVQKQFVSSYEINLSGYGFFLIKPPKK